MLFYTFTCKNANSFNLQVLCSEIVFTSAFCWVPNAWKTCVFSHKREHLWISTWPINWPWKCMVTIVSPYFAKEQRYASLSHSAAPVGVVGFLAFKKSDDQMIGWVILQTNKQQPSPPKKRQQNIKLKGLAVSTHPSQHIWWVFAGRAARLVSSASPRLGWWSQWKD